MKNVKNPDNGYIRDDMSYDVEYSTPASTFKTRDLWIDYGEYVKKFSIALYYAHNNEAGTGAFLNTRSYGVCHSAWTGYRPAKKLLYVVNS